MPNRSRSIEIETTSKSYLNQLAAELVAESTGKALPRSAAVQQVRAQGVGVSGGRKGGPARAAIMTPEQRSATASKAARTKWAKFRAKKKT